MWAPHYNKDIKLIEGVYSDRRATKIVQCIGHLSYDETLEYLGLTRLDRRRIRDLIETYKILNRVYSIPRDTCFQFGSLSRLDYEDTLKRVNYSRNI